MVAEIASDLHEALLFCCGFEERGFASTQESGAAFFEDLVVLRGRPLAIALPDAGGKELVLAGH